MFSSEASLNELMEIGMASITSEKNAYVPLAEAVLP